MASPIVNCDFCEAPQTERLSIVYGSSATVYDKGAKKPRAPFICEKCAIRALAAVYANAAQQIATLRAAMVPAPAPAAPGPPSGGRA